MQLKSMITGGAILLAATSSASANSYNWNWTSDIDSPSPNDAGGVMNWVDTSFDSVTNQLSWTFNVGRTNEGFITDAFTLAINNGPNPKGEAGELALLYFDGSQGAANNPIMSVYGYNARNNFSSYYDGAPQSGVQTPDLIASSLVSTDWIQDRYLTDNIDGTRTIGFSIDASAINGYDPLNSVDGVDWTGMAMDEQLGFWFHSFAGTETRYGADGFLARGGDDNGLFRGNDPGSWRAKRHGWFDTSGQPTSTEPVPEPTTIALMGTGLAGLMGRIRRKKKSADA